ncbi:MAG: hypothetical protein KC441_04310, partial [Anaerolineales bacterium]|nr:hypothetical protein [Anaerolineales bacterium]
AQVIDDLLALIDRQRQLLEFACNQDQFDESVLRADLGDQFAGWILRHSDLSNSLTQLLSCVQADKAKVLADFDHDQNFWDQMDDSTFKFAFSLDKSTAHKKAKECLNFFYGAISATGPLFPTPKQFKRADIINGYIETNPLLRFICPCCDGNWPELSGKDKTPYTLEHFFHKEAHPTICLHPFNLIPMCEVCNSRRGDKEVLGTAPGIQVGAHKIFHPLFRPAKEKVELQYYSPDLRPERLQFVNLPTQLDDWREAIAVYDRLYEIPQRWQERWDEIDSVISIQLRTALEAHRYMQQTPLSLIDFERLLGGIIKSLNEHNGRYQYVAQRWLVWAKQYYLERLYEAHVTARSFTYSPH